MSARTEEARSLNQASRHWRKSASYGSPRQRKRILDEDNSRNRYKREYFSSHPAQVMVFRFTAVRNASLSGTVSLGNQHEIPTIADNETLVMKGNTSTFWLWEFVLASSRGGADL